MHGKVNGLRWIILALVVVTGGVSYILRTNVSVIGGTMREDLGISEIQLGLIFSAFAAGYALFQFPGGIFGDKFGARVALVAIAIAWGVLTVVTGLVPDTTAWSVTAIVGFLIVTRFLVGMTHAPIFPITNGRLVSRWFPIGQWGLPNGLTSTGLTLGAAATAPLLVWLMSLYGWRESLFITAPVAFIIALVWWFVVRDDPAQHPLMTQAEHQVIIAGRKPSTDGAKSDWRAVLKNREILLLAFSYFCMNYVFYLFFNWFFYYLVDVKGFAAEEAGLLTAALWIIGAVGATIGGFGCDRLIARYGLRWGPAILAGGGLVLCALFLLAGALTAAPYLAIAFLCICFGFTQITEAAFWSTAIAV